MTGEQLIEIRLRLRSRRITKNWSQRDLARVMKVGQSTVHNLEAGNIKRLRLGLLITWSEALGDPMEVRFRNAE